jgi:Peptidase C13 family
VGSSHCGKIANRVVFWMAFKLSVQRTLNTLATALTSYACVVKGSAGWGNYRHQADVCHVRFCPFLAFSGNVKGKPVHLRFIACPLFACDVDCFS